MTFRRLSCFRSSGFVLVSMAFVRIISDDLAAFYSCYALEGTMALAVLLRVTPMGSFKPYSSASSASLSLW